MSRSEFAFIASAFLLAGCFPEASNSSDEQQSTSGCGSDVVCKAWLDTHNERRAELNAGTVTDDGPGGNYSNQHPYSID